jgi:hypothetical protein
MMSESESKSRKNRIDPRLETSGWKRMSVASFHGPRRSEEEPMANGPADYALWLDDHVAGVGS